MAHRLLVLALLGGCLEPNLVACPGSDRVCAPGMICDAVHDTCISPDQQRACDGLADHASCNLNGDVGTCLDGVCFVAVCGDGFVAPGEACDDGNRTSGDGCNASCTSTELCGNGVVDPGLGEQCDDGNTIAGDGCDSQCRRETETWSLVGVRPEYAGGSGHTVYDPQHHHAIHVVDGITWTWDGTAWSIVAATGLGYAPWPELQLVWDPDRNGVVLIGGAMGSSTLDQVWTWDGAAWTRVAVTGSSPSVFNTRAAYDRARHVILVAGLTGSTEVLWSLDLATAHWTQLASPPLPTFPGGIAFAYDDARSLGVMVAQAQAKVIEWNGTAWSALLPATLANTGNYSVTYDPRLAAVIAIGGSIGAVSKWTGTAWMQLANETPPEIVLGPDVWFDADRQRRVAVSNQDHLLEWDGAAWTRPPDITPTVWTYSFFTDFAYDWKRGELLVYGGSPAVGIGTELWAYDGHWRELEPSPASYAMNPYGNRLAYDPVRDAVVLNTSTKATYLLVDEHWVTLEAPGASALAGGVAVAFDPLQRRMLSFTTTGVWALPSDGGTQWTKLSTTGPSLSSSTTAALDARDGVFATQGTAGLLLFDGATFQASLSPGPSYTVVGDTRRGTVELVSIGGTSSSWERVDGQWFERDPIPFPVDGLPIYDPRGGRVLVAGVIGHSRVIAVRSFAGASPLEACTGNDDDGDGLVDCADPDCFWSCTPACPPRVSCP